MHTVQFGEMTLKCFVLFIPTGTYTVTFGGGDLCLFGTVHLGGESILCSLPSLRVFLNVLYNG